MLSTSMPKGEIVLGCLAPHPPHVVYAENPDQNEPVSEGGWETLRWGYNRLARKLKTIDYDALVIFTPHWQTYIGTHFLGLPEFKSKSVDPVFPNIFRYNYDIKVDVELSEIMREKASEGERVAKLEQEALETWKAKEATKKREQERLAREGVVRRRGGLMCSLCREPVVQRHRLRDCGRRLRHPRLQVVPVVPVSRGPSLKQRRALAKALLKI